MQGRGFVRSTPYEQSPNICWFCQYPKEEIRNRQGYNEEHIPFSVGKVDLRFIRLKSR